MLRIGRPKWGFFLAPLIALFCGICRPSVAGAIYVNKNATGAIHDGTSWATAFKSVQPGIAAAAAGDEVWVATGTYSENIALKGGVPVYGGFEGTESASSQRDWKTNVTVLSGNGMVVTSSSEAAVLDGFSVLSNGLTGVNVPSGSATLANCSVSSTTYGVFVGPGGHVTITNVTSSGNRYGIVACGTANIAGCDISGNAVGVDLESGQATISDSSISANVDGVSARGGAATLTNCTLSGNNRGVYAALGSTAAISGSTFSGNTSYGIDTYGLSTVTNSSIAGSPYGIYVRSGPATSVTHCTLRGNSSEGIHVDPNGAATVTDCIISRNTSCGISASGSAIITSCAIEGNSFGIEIGRGASTVSRCKVSGNKYGVCINGQGSASITDCVSTGNTYGIFTAGPGVTTIANTDIIGNVAGVNVDGGTSSLANCVLAYNRTGVFTSNPNRIATLSHSDVYGSTKADFSGMGDPTGANGNISLDPLFANQANGDYHLLPGSPCIDAGDDSALTSGETDLDGMPRISGPHTDIGAYEWQQANTTWTASLGSASGGGVTVAEKTAYVAGNDGRLYARNTEDGSAIAGFPVDIDLVVGATVKLPSRPAVYYGKTGKAIYLTTDRGDVLRILPNGSVAWHVHPLTGQTVSTPAVTPDGEVFVNLSTGSGTYSNYVFKLDEATGAPLSVSPFLGHTSATDSGDFSPAASSRYLYVNAGWASGSGLTLLNQDNLAVRSSFASGEQCLPPLLLDHDLILATRCGRVYKMNAVTLNPDMGFGHSGVADVGSQISAAPFADAGGNVYVGTADGRILKWAPGTPSFQTLYTASGRIAGLTVNRSAGVLGFGTSDGKFVQIPLGNPGGATVVSAGGSISTGTVYEALTNRFIVVTDNGVLGGYPAVK